MLDGSGRELASNNDAPGLGVDARVEVSFPKAGDYYVLVHDAKYSNQEQNFYRLKIGSFTYADGIFPLGWQRGGTVEVSLFGGNLEAPVKVKPNLALPASQNYVPVSLPGGASLPFQFVLGDLPEILEPAEAGPGQSQAIYRLPPATVVNGRISRPGEMDKYRLSVSPGQHWTFEVEAAALGTSRLDAFLSLYDPKTNKPLALADLLDKDDPYKQLIEAGKVVLQRLSYSVPKDVKEVIVAVEDLLGRGGPNYSYRLWAREQPPDFSIEVATPFVNIPANGTSAIEVMVKRRSYLGPIHLSIPDLPDDILQEGGDFPAENTPQIGARPGYITLTAKPEAKRRSFPISVWGEAVSSDPPLRRKATVPGMITVVKGTDQKPFQALWLDTALPAATAKAVPLSLEVPDRHIRLPQGRGYELHWKLIKPSQMPAPIKVFPRASYFLKDFLVERRKLDKESEYPNEGVFNLTTSLTTPAVTFDLILDGVSQGGDEYSGEKLVTARAVTVEIVPLYQLKLLSEKLEIKRGAKLELIGKVQREPAFEGVIRVRAEGLPEQVTCPEVVIAGDQNDFRLVFEAGPDAKAGEFEVHLGSSASVPENKEKQDYIIPELKARLVVSPETVPVQAAK